ncbi:MAG: DinB family protein [Pyrinomonadaceae bacterium]
MFLRKFTAFFSVATAMFVFTVQLSAQAPIVKTPVVFTEKDREFALKYLNQTKDDFVKQLGGISDAQLNFRAAEGRWTIGEIAEHIIVVENALFGMITTQAMKSPPPKCDDVFRMSDTALILAVTNRSQKFTAPEQVRPNGRWKTRDDLLANFDKTRNQTADFMKSNAADLRGTFMQNPFGTIDSYQWFLFLNGHSERHLAQLKEVKADKKYPKK